MIHTINHLFDQLDRKLEKLSNWQEELMYEPIKTENFVSNSLSLHLSGKGIPLKLGGCIIGDMNNMSVRVLFNLSENMIFLH